MKKVYKVEVDCANCANKMEEAAGKVAGVEELTISFMTQKMTVRFAEGADVAAVMKKVADCCKKVDDDFSIQL